MRSNISMVKAPFESWDELSSIHDYKPGSNKLQIIFKLSKAGDGELAVGVDEAGRGAVIGPLVFCAFFCPAQQVESLKTKYKCNDSKALSATSRQAIYDSLHDALDKMGTSYVLGILSPRLISGMMLARKRNVINLNELSHATVCKILNAAVERSKFRNDISVYLDTVGPCETYKQLMRNSVKYGKLKTVEVSEKAESKYPCVAAASIIAKVSRDAMIPQNCGSGYPSDPSTQEYLKDSVDPVFGFSCDTVRFSWSTVKKIIEEHCFEVSWPDDGEEEERATPAKRKNKSSKHDGKTKDIRKFFKRADAGDFPSNASLAF